MAEGLIIEFEGVGRDMYYTVSRSMGVDVDSGTGDWPAGLRFHAGGGKPGGWVVFEVWDSRADQEQFMAERLGPAPPADGGPEAPVVCGFDSRALPPAVAGRVAQVHDERVEVIGDASGGDRAEAPHHASRHTARARRDRSPRLPRGSRERSSHAANSTSSDQAESEGKRLANQPRSCSTRRAGVSDGIARAHAQHEFRACRPMIRSRLLLTC